MLHDEQHGFYTWERNGGCNLECCSSCKKKKSKNKAAHVCIEFCVRLEETPKETIALLKCYFNRWLESQFCKTFEDKWSELMQPCVLSRSHYFEKDRSKNEDVNSSDQKNISRYR